jgi:hypothetical protein
MSPSARNRFLLAGLVALVALGLGGGRSIFNERARLSAARARSEELNAEIAVLRESGKATQINLVEAERQLAALPSAPADGKDDSPQTAERKAWLARIKGLKRVFAEQPGQRIPEMKLLEESDWLQATQFPIETEPQFRMALAQVREAARVRFRPQMISALRKYEIASDHQLPASILALAPYFESPADPAMLQQYELIEQGSMTMGGSTFKLAFRPRAPVDEIYEYRSTFNGAGSGSSGGNPASWVPDYSARSRQAHLAYARDHPSAPVPSIRELVPYFDPPLSTAFVEGYDAFMHESGRPR